MEGELFNAIQKQESGAPAEVHHEVKPAPEFSFVPPELLKKEMIKTQGQGFCVREKCAVVGAVFGGIALVSWVVILLGILAAIAGIALSVAGLKSKSSRYARIGLGLSILGLVAALLYAFAAYQGMINYNYFTSEFWAKSTTE